MPEENDAAGWRTQEFRRGREEGGAHEREVPGPGTPVQRGTAGFYPRDWKRAAAARQRGLNQAVAVACEYSAGGAR
jgi:hypothetical protein